MKPKKTPQADLESKRKVFLQLGFVISLAILLMAFEWSSIKNPAMILASNTEVLPDDWKEVTIQDKSDQIERPKPKLFLTEIIQIIDDGSELEDNLDIDTETDENEKVLAPEVNYEPEPEDNFYYIVSDMPVFMPKINKTVAAGDQALANYLANNTRYPADAREAGLQGKVYVSFIVNSSGRVEQVKLARSIHPSLDNEAIRVIESLPRFKPGRQMTKLVNVSYTVPINFVLN